MFYIINIPEIERYSKPQARTELVTLREHLETRGEWCHQAARQFMKTKSRRKYYQVEYTIDNSRERFVDLIPLLDEEIGHIRQAIQKDIDENGPWPKGKEDECRRDIISDIDYDFDIAEYTRFGAGSENVFKVTNVKDDSWWYQYDVLMIRLDENAKPEKSEKKVMLYDDEYVEILTDLLFYKEGLSFNGLSYLRPHTCKKIWLQSAMHNVTSAIILTEMNKDVEAIYAQNGGRENTPFFDEATAYNVDLIRQMCPRE